MTHFPKALTHPRRSPKALKLPQVSALGVPKQFNDIINQEYQPFSCQSPRHSFGGLLSVLGLFVGVPTHVACASWGSKEA